MTDPAEQVGSGALEAEAIREALNPVYTTPAKAVAAFDALDSLLAYIKQLERVTASVRSKTALDVVAEKMAAEDRAEVAEARIKQLEGERNAEREKFHRHVEEMIKPKLLARLEAVSRENERLREALERIADEYEPNTTTRCNEIARAALAAHTEEQG
jgi:hypothetical protein